MLRFIIILFSNCGALLISKTKKSEVATDFEVSENIYNYENVTLNIVINFKRLNAE